MPWQKQIPGRSAPRAREVHKGSDDLNLEPVVGIGELGFHADPSRSLSGYDPFIPDGIHLLIRGDVGKPYGCEQELCLPAADLRQGLLDLSEDVAGLLRDGELERRLGNITGKIGSIAHHHEIAVPRRHAGAPNIRHVPPLLVR
jgi:hypothetical protein